MDRQIMYSAKVNSPSTRLVLDISETDVELVLVDGSILPSVPNLLTIGTGENAETVKLTVINGNTITVERGFQGVAKAWRAGDVVARVFTAYDHDAFKNNITELQVGVDVINLQLPDKADNSALSTLSNTVDNINNQLGNKVENSTFTTTISGINASLASKADQSATNTALGNKVDKISGKGLSANDYTNEDKNTVSTVANKADKTYVDTQDIADRVYAKQLVEPTATYATLAALQTAFPTGNSNEYVVTADGKRYYWNNTAWVPGSIYNIANDSLTYDHVKKQTFQVFRGIGNLYSNTNKLTIGTNGMSASNGTTLTLVNADEDFKALDLQRVLRAVYPANLTSGQTLCLQVGNTSLGSIVGGDTISFGVAVKVAQNSTSLNFGVSLGFSNASGYMGAQYNLYSSAAITTPVGKLVFVKGTGTVPTGATSVAFYISNPYGSASNMQMDFTSWYIVKGSSAAVIYESDADRLLQTSDITDKAVTGPKIADNTITGANIALNTIPYNSFADTAIASIQNESATTSLNLNIHQNIINLFQGFKEGAPVGLTTSGNWTLTWIDNDGTTPVPANKCPKILKCSYTNLSATGFVNVGKNITTLTTKAYSFGAWIKKDFTELVFGLGIRIIFKDAAQSAICDVNQTISQANLYEGYKLTSTAGGATYVIRVVKETRGYIYVSIVVNNLPDAVTNFSQFWQPKTSTVAAGSTGAVTIIDWTIIPGDTILYYNIYKDKPDSELVVKKPYEGKRYLFIGDSITAEEYRWVSQFVAAVKAASYVNVAVSGAHWCDYSDTVYDGNPVFNGPDANHNNVLGNQVQKVLNNDYPAFDAIIIAAGTNDYTPLMNIMHSIAYEQLTVASTAVSLTSATYGTATAASITVADAQIRFRTDGTAPTATTGHLVSPGDKIQLESNSDIKNFKAIAVGAMSAIMSISYSVEYDEIEPQFTENGAYKTVASADRKIFAGAIRYCVETLLNKYPNAQIFISLPIQGSEGMRSYKSINTKGQMISAIAHRLALPVIDAAECGIYGGFELDSASGKYLSDGLHPKTVGGNVLGAYIARKVINWFAF